MLVSFSMSVKDAAPCFVQKLAIAVCFVPMVLCRVRRFSLNAKAALAAASTDWRGLDVRGERLSYREGCLTAPECKV